MQYDSWVLTSKIYIMMIANNASRCSAKPRGWSLKIIRQTRITFYYHNLWHYGTCPLHFIIRSYDIGSLSCSFQTLFTSRLIRCCKLNRLIWVCIPRHACSRKKSTSRKYDPPYVKKPIAKSFAGGSTTSNNSQEDISMDGGKLHSFNNTFRYNFYFID